MSIEKGVDSYFMEACEEAKRLDLKTDPDALQKQAQWCGLHPGARVLDVGCGSGRATAILHELVQPGGSVLGIDYSPERIEYAEQHFASIPGLHFELRDFMAPLEDLGPFDFIWGRFVFEYYRSEVKNIIDNLTSCLDSQGVLCLLDLDYNCMSHYPLSQQMEVMVIRIMETLEREYNFDPYVGRKFYSYLIELGYRDIEVNMMPHHLIYGELKPTDLYNWTQKVQIAVHKMASLFEAYPGGGSGFLADFREYFTNSRRFTYTPLLLCKGKKPQRT